LRKFLKEGGNSESPASPIRAAEFAWSVVIDHHAAAHFSRSGRGVIPRTEVTIEPYDPHHFHHHLVAPQKKLTTRADRVPEETLVL